MTEDAPGKKTVYRKHPFLELIASGTEKKKIKSLLIVPHSQSIFQRGQDLYNKNVREKLRHQMNSSPKVPSRTKLQILFRERHSKHRPQRIPIGKFRQTWALCRKISLQNIRK